MKKKKLKLLIEIKANVQMSNIEMVNKYLKELNSLIYYKAVKLYA